MVVSSFPNLHICSFEELHLVPEVFVTPVHSIPHQRKDAASVWSRDVTTVGFKLYLREVTNFSGGHANIRVVSETFLAWPTVLSVSEMLALLSTKNLCAESYIKFHFSRFLQMTWDMISNRRHMKLSFGSRFVHYWPYWMPGYRNNRRKRLVLLVCKVISYAIILV